jgi:hypothetical protein
VCKERDLSIKSEKFIGLTDEMGKEKNGALKKLCKSGGQMKKSTYLCFLIIIGLMAGFGSESFSQFNITGPVKNGVGGNIGAGGQISMTGKTNKKGDANSEAEFHNRVVQAAKTAKIQPAKHLSAAETAGLYRQLKANEKSALVNSNNEAFNLDGNIWLRNLGEKEYYLTPTVKDINTYKARISKLDNKEEAKVKSGFSVVKVELNAASISLLSTMGIKVPEYVTGTINVMLPQIDIDRLTENQVGVEYLADYGKKKMEVQKQKASTNTIIWSEGFEGSISQYQRGDATSTSGLDYFGDVNCFYRSGRWSLWCNGVGDRGACTTYDNNMGSYFGNITPVNLANVTSPQMDYYIYYVTEIDYDYASYWYSSDGTNYTLGPVYQGNSGGWVHQTLTLSGFTNFYWLFNFHSDGSNSYAGVYIDDMSISGTTYSLPNLSLNSNNSSIDYNSTTSTVVCSLLVVNQSCNSGTSPTITGEFYSSMYLSTDNTYSANDKLIGTWRWTDGLADGYGVNCTGTINLNSTPGLAPGSYYVIFVIDDLSEINECNETDNIWVRNSPITFSQGCTITANPSVLSIPSSGGTVQTTVSSSACAWSLAASPSTGLTFNTTSGGSGNTTLNITSAANNTGTTKTWQVYIIGASGASGDTITVIQSPASPCTVTANPSSLTIPSGGGSAQTTVTSSSCNWTLSSVPATGLSFSTTYGSAGQTLLTVTAPANNTSSNMSWVVTLSNGTGQGGSSFTVTQPGSAPVQCTIVANPSGISIPAAGGTAQTTITSTACDWTLTANPTSGITIDRTSGSTGSTTVTVSASANTTNSSRSWTLNITSASGSGSATVSVTQPAGSSCAPNWQPRQNQQYNMSVIAKLKFGSQISTNTNDMIAAFVGSECRGKANVMSNGLIFLTVTSDAASGETITFKGFNSNNCEVKDVSASAPIVFQNQAEIGTIDSAKVFSDTQQSLTISFGTGYTWFSVNTNPGSLSLNSLFVPPLLTPAANDRIIGQNSFASWSGSQWIGSLTEINPKQSYKMKLASGQTWTIQGQSVPDSAIVLNTGYTWLGYSAKSIKPVNEALAGLTPAPASNDRINSQTSFASWSGSAWLGSLTQMEPGKGYTIKLTNNSVLSFPSSSAIAKNSSSVTGEYALNAGRCGWKSAENMQYNMNVIAKVSSENGRYMIGAFVGTECRGIAPVKDGLAFLTISSNSESGETVTIKIYDAIDNTVSTMPGGIQFENQQETGTLQQPYVILPNTDNAIEKTTISAYSDKNNRVILSWGNESNSKTAGYIVERLNTNGKWESVGYVSADGQNSLNFTDEKIKENGKYSYRIKQAGENGTGKYSPEVSVEMKAVPGCFELSQNYPNPFNPSCAINYSVPRESHVTIRVYNMLGQTVAMLVNEKKTAGNYSTQFNAQNLSNGVYFYEMTADNYKNAKKLMLLK